MKKRYKVLLVVIVVFFVWYLFALPQKLFQAPYATVIEDRNGNLLSAQIASDGQWRFPLIDSVPFRFERSIITFEDKRFYKHPGVDIRSLFRALYQNISSWEIVSGASTISMQTIRLSRSKGSRNISRKLIEIILATRLEWKYNKQEILQLYSSHAPFGGNVVGLEAASWRYFQKSPYLLSWGESAVLAVLPNAPGLIHPGKNQNLLKQKRDRLLKRLHTKGIIDAQTLELALLEPLPAAPNPLPRHAPHLLEKFKQKGAGKRYKTTIDQNLQLLASNSLNYQYEFWKQNGIHNGAVFVLDIKTNEVLVYLGNVQKAGEDHHNEVDVIQAPRSTGSILKPLLYSAMLNEGKILPQMLVSDIPTIINGYKPENFYQSFEGAIPADQALAKSLNIPFVQLLQKYGLEKFHYELTRMGMSTLNFSPDHYGLTLILGGAEGTLEDLTNVYSNLGRHLSNFSSNSTSHNTKFKTPVYTLQQAEKTSHEKVRMSPGAIWLTFRAMQKLSRPDSEGNWEKFASSQKISWKTGTSFGFRDAWAIGLNGRYAVGVWVGNADGEGRPNLVGVKAAAPLLFEVFDHLPSEQWFATPYNDLKRVVVCKNTGYQASPICPKDTILAPFSAPDFPTCLFHRKVQLSRDGAFRVNSSCALPHEMLNKTYFILPPIEASYYQIKNPSYEILPPYAPDCKEDETSEDIIQLIYPPVGTKIMIPKDLGGEESKTIFKVAHIRPDKKIYWHLDNFYLGETQHFHTMELRPKEGEHQLILVDEDGNTLSRNFEIVAK
ncbi:MAG: penicillin-binding protein 1C [Bacteroidota bacterium]